MPEPDAAAKLPGARRDAMTLADTTNVRDQSGKNDLLELLSHALDTLGSSLCLLSRHGDILFTNQAWRRFSEDNDGSGDACSYNYFMVCERSARHGCSSAAEFLAGLRGVLDGTLPEFSCDYDCHSPAEQRWFTAHVTRFVWNRDFYLLVRHYNSTNRILAEEWGYEHRSRFQALFEQGAVGMAICNLQGRFIEANPAFRSITGFSRAELLQYSCREITHPEDLACDQSHLERLLRGESSTYTTEKRYIRKNGEPVWVQLTVSLLTDRHDRPVAYVSIVEDISLRKLALRTLQESEQRFSTLANAARDAIIMMDDQGLISYWNPAARDIFGYEADEVLGSDLHALLAPRRYHPTATAAVLAWSRSGCGDAIGRQSELVGQRKNGEEFHIELSLSSVPLQGRWIAIGILRDITLRKRTEEQLEQARYAAETANRAKTVFLANVSHELRSPLNAIIGFTELLHDDVDDSLTPQQKEYAGIVLQSSRHLLAIISQILDLSKIEAGEMTLNPEPLSPLEPITLAMTMVTARYQKKQIQLTEEHCPAVSRTMIRCDEVKLRQIMLNLLSNACKFTPEGGTVTVGSRLVERNDISGYLPLATGSGQRFVEIWVRDSGIGIREEDMPLLFLEFSQLDTTATRKHEGTGLGLALTKRLVEMHGGRIKATSSFGAGSCFSFILPV